MSRTRAAAWLAAATVVLLPFLSAGGAGAATQASGAPTPAPGAATVVSTDVSKFPSVLVTVSLPGVSDLGIRDVTLSENGNVIPSGGKSGVIVKSLAVSSAEYQSVVFAIDNSRNVSAGALKTMLNAAETFIGTCPDTVPFGVVTLASKPQVLQKAVFHDQPQARRALDSVRPSSSPASLDEGFHAAIGAMAPRGQRNIVVLSGSATAAQSLSHKTASAVGRTGARVFAIVPGSNEGNDLPALVDKSAGSITQTSVGRLPGATNALAHVVGDQYLFSYQSVASPGDLLDISMTVKGHPLKTEVTVPSSATPNASPTPNPALFSGTRGYLLIAVIIVALLVLTSIPGRVRRRRRASGGGGGNRGGGGGGEGPRRRERRERRREERQRR